MNPIGLGSKSPFAYTDQFTAISRFEGVKYTYAAFIGESNVPEISLVGQEDTDEVNGFEVHVPVKESDIYTFERTAKRVFEFFDVKPILNQSIDFTVYDEPVMTMEYDDIECSLYSNQDTTMVMQGPIGYPVDAYAVMTDLDYHKRSKVETFFQKGWRIKAPVGTFEITASREALSYDKKTIAKLLEAANGVLQQVKCQAEEKLKDIDSLKDAAELIIASTKYLPGSLSLEGAAWNGLTWDGHGFEVDLPPGTQCREIIKRQYGRGSDPHQTDTPLFITRDGESYINAKGKARAFDNLWQRFMKKVESTGTERFQERDLRAKVASDSDSLLEASERLGHADTAITQRVYRRKPVRVQPLINRPKV